MVVTGNYQISSIKDSMLFRNGATVNFTLSNSIPDKSIITSVKIKIPVYIKGNNGAPANGTFQYNTQNGKKSSLTLNSLVLTEKELIPSGTFEKGAFGANAYLSTNESFSKIISNSCSTATLTIYGQFVGFNTGTVFSHNQDATIRIDYTPPTTTGGSGGGTSGGDNGNTISYSSPQISYNSSTYNLRALSDGTMTQTVTFNVNPVSGSNRSFTCSDPNITIQNSTSANPKAIGAFKGGQSYTFYATNSYNMQSSRTITFNTISKLTTSITFDNNNTLIDYSPTNGYGLCKEIQKLKGIAYLDNQESSNVSSSWSYSFGTTAALDEVSYDLDISSNTISVLDIKSKTSSKNEKVLEGYYYQIYYNASYTDSLSGYTQIANSELEILRYPKSLKDLSEFYIDNVYNGGISGEMVYNRGDDGYFNNNCYFNINYPSLSSNNGYSKIKTINILLSECDRDSFNPVKPKYTNEKVIQSYIYGQQPTSYDVDITNINRGNYIQLGVKLIDYLGQTITITRNKNDDSNVDFSRINLPYFGTTTINSSAPSTITVNYNPILSSTNNNLLSLAIPTPYTYNTNTSSLNGSTLVSLLKNLNLRDKNNNNFFTFKLSSLINDVTYNKNTSTGYIYITLTELKNKFSAYLSQNEVLELKINLSFIDDFGNECSQDFTINHFDNVINDVITLNFGAPPIMPDYNSSNYYMNISYNGIDNKKLITNNTMINSGDVLSITFPKATDANGENNIEAYIIKIYRSDSDLSSYNVENNDYQVLATIPKSSFSSILNNNLYTYNHTVNNYLVTKFIKLAVVARDAQKLESNIIEYPFTLVAGRIDSSKSYVKSFQDNGNNTYNFNLTINDIGGNIFNNKDISYIDYPNLEREYNLYGQSRSITIDIEHRDSNDLDPSIYKNKLEKINFKVGDLAENNNYTNSYNTILTNYISINNLNLSTFNINSSIKNYYRFIIHVQVGFDKEGKPIYQTGYSSTYVSYPSTPTVAYRKNHIGLNTDNFNNYDNAILVTAAGVDSRNILYFISENNISLVNVDNGEIDGFIIDGGEW